MAGSNGKLREISRRTALGALGAGIVGATVASWPRLTGMDIPGRGDNSLSIAILGTAADAAARQRVIDAFAKVHPEIKVKVQAIQAADWKDFFTKILTMVAAGTPPDVVYVATEGAQLFAEKLAHPLDEYLRRDAADMKEYFADVHPSLVEAFMYKGSLFQLPIDWNAANMYYNTSALQQAGLERPADNWTQVDFRSTLASMRKARPQDFTPYYWTNRLFGGVVPWLYANDTSFLKESKSTGGEWLWTASTPRIRHAGCAPAATSGLSPTRMTRGCTNRSTTSAASSRMASAFVPRRVAEIHSSGCSPPTGSA
ncbi:trehalose/maltose-binding protein MalE [Arthrobacter sp. Hiyo8]|nr:trehalose/maltose-binding protein MalE [Arthrobacter sp. Hiyo8]